MGDGAGLDGTGVFGSPHSGKWRGELHHEAGRAPKGPAGREEVDWSEAVGPS